MLIIVKQVKEQCSLLKKQQQKTTDLFDESVVVYFDVNVDRCGGEILEYFSEQGDALVLTALTVTLCSDKG